MTNQSPRRKHVPQRTCIACRAIAGKRGLIRLVRTRDGHVAVDPTGKQAGRGAYLHPDPACWARALENRQVERALRTKLNAADRQALVDYMATLPAIIEQEGAVQAADEYEEG
jgi:predicted RNA-binding protein YlxR (DUF448 family)